MTTLTQPGLSSLIDRLFAEADAAEDALAIVLTIASTMDS